MGFKATNTDTKQVIRSWQYNKIEWERLQEAHREADNDLFTCPSLMDNGLICGQKLIPKRRSDTGTQFFSHHSKGYICNSDQDYLHDLLELSIHQVLSHLKIDCELEKRIDYDNSYLIADVFFRHLDKNFVVEIQLSPQKPTVYYERSSKYRFTNKLQIDHVLWLTLDKDLEHRRMFYCRTLCDQDGNVPSREKLKQLLEQKFLFVSDSQTTYTLKQFFTHYLKGQIK